jgi:hypothetical protein
MDLPIIRLKDMRVYYFYLIIAMLGISTYYGFSQSFISFEKGIEIVRSRGYLINGEMEWELAYTEDWKVSERGLGSFLDACDRLKREHGSLTVYADFYAKVLFVFDSSPELSGRMLYFCNFT